MAKKVIVGGRIESKEVGGIVTGAAEILDDTKGKKQNVINQETDAEMLRLDQSKQNNLTFDNVPTEGSNNPVKSAGVYEADKALSDAIEAILLLIPSAASALNKLVDMAMMNSSISTATATFKGTYNVVTDLGLTIDATHEQIAAKLGEEIETADNNDYAFVQIPVSAESTDIRRTERYKFNGTAWGYEYDLNTSGFTAAQWAAINSGITLALVGKLIGLPTSSELIALLGQKQDTLTFDNVPTSGSANPVKSGGVYSAINEEKTAREQLAQSVDGINGRLGNVEEVIPSGAAANNKLVANNSMEAYVASIIQNITASFTIATADGHINLTLTQTNGRVASLTLTSSDIASAQALTALTGRVSTAEGNITTLGVRVSTNETDIANLQQLYNDLQQSKPEPVTALPSTGQQQGVIYRLAGTTSYSDYMWNGSTWVLMATYNNAIDDVPTAGSNNLVKSGGVVIKLMEEVGLHVNFSEITNTPILYDDNNRWIINSSNNQGAYFPCIPGNKYEISPAEGSSFVLVSFLKSMDYSSTPDYADGTGRYSFSEKTEIIAPSDAKYIWIMTKYGGVVRIPKVTVYGYVLSELENIDKKIEDVNDVFSGIAGLTLYSGWLNSPANNIVAYGTSKFVIIPVSGRKNLHITTGAKSVNFFIAKNYGTKLPVTIELATGETGRRTIGKNLDNVIELPSDAAYVYLQIINFQNENIQPAYLYIDDIQMIPDKEEGMTEIRRDKQIIESALTSPVAGEDASKILTFIHTSDTHLRSNNDKLFKTIASLLAESYINCMIHTGDIVWDNFPSGTDYSAEGLSIFNTIMQSISKDVIISVGNHDVGGEYKAVATSGTDKQVYDTFYAPLMKSNFVSGGTDKPYFYVDYSQGIRLISLYQYNSDFELDPNDSSKLKYIRGKIAYRQEEIDWLCSTLNSTPEGYAVFIITHQPESFGNKENSWQSRRLANMNYGHLLTDIVNAFANRTSVNTSITQDVGVVGTITAEYDFSQAVGVFAGFLNGHTHDDFVGHELHHGLNVINKCCDNVLYQTGCSIRHIWNSYSENTINVVSINTANRIITVFRLGGKYTADGDFRNVTTLTY